MDNNDTSSPLPPPPPTTTTTTTKLKPSVEKTEIDAVKSYQGVPIITPHIACREKRVKIVELRCKAGGSFDEGNYKEASKYIQQVLDIDPTNPGTFALSSKVSEAQGNLDSAIIQQLIAIGAIRTPGGIPSANIRLLQLYLKKKNKVKCNELCEKIQKMHKRREDEELFRDLVEKVAKLA